MIHLIIVLTVKLILILNIMKEKDIIYCYDAFENFSRYFSFRWTAGYELLISFVLSHKSITHS